MSKQYSDVVTFTWPTKGETNWSSIVDVALTVLAGLTLNNNTAFRGRNVSNSGDVNLFKVNTANLFSVLTPLILDSTETLTGNNTSEAVSTAKIITISNKASSGSAALTLADGSEGQIKLVHNKNSSSIVCTPATTAGTNTATLSQRGTVLYVFLDSEWRAFAGAGCTLA